MKIIIAVVTMVALMEGPCYAQINAAPEGKKGTWSQAIGEQERKEREDREKKLDAAVKAAGDRIPEPKVKFDPWKNAR